MSDCTIDGCDLPHCRKCGHHFDPACVGGSNVCDQCQIDAAAAECEQIVRAFGGNSEEAAKAMGW